VLDQILRLFSVTWVTFALIVNLISVGSIWWFEGWRTVSEIYNPFNPMNALLEIVLLSPAIAAAVWLDRRHRRPAPDKALRGRAASQK
jgi:hypothetical protein